MASSVSSTNDTLDVAVLSKSSDTSSLQKKLQKIDKCIAVEETTLRTIQDDLIKLGIRETEKCSPAYQKKVQHLENSNNLACMHIQAYKEKRKKYDLALKCLENQCFLDQQKVLKEQKSKSLPKNASLSQGVSVGVEVSKGTNRMLDTFLRGHVSGESGESSRTKDSRCSREENPNLHSGGPALGAGDGLAGLIVRGTAHGQSVDSGESISDECRNKQRRVEEIGEIVDAKLEPLVGDMQEVKDRVEQLFKLADDSNIEASQERKANIVIFDDIIRRCAYVEEQIHDLIELHQKEIAETKMYLVDTQDKMNYVYHERIRDMKDEITGLHTRLAKIEHRQKEDESLARTEAAKSVMSEMAFKMVDCVLLFGQLIIAVVGAVTQFFHMTAENSTRLVVFLVGVIAFLVVFQFRADLPFSPQLGEFLERVRDVVMVAVFGANVTVGESHREVDLDGVVEM